jgi:hypothetical protein
MGRQAYLTRLALVSGINGALSNSATSVLAFSQRPRTTHSDRVFSFVMGSKFMMVFPIPTWEAFSLNFLEMPFHSVTESIDWNHTVH